MHKLWVVVVLFWSLSLRAESLLIGEVVVDGVSYFDIETAQKHIDDNSVIYLGPGEYTKGLVINKNNVVLSGSSGTKFLNVVIYGKGSIITSGKDITIENIECSGVSVSAGNGACIRHEGRNLTLNNVYFHDSQQGLLETKNDGYLVIKNSRFERLGHKGRAHGIYTNGAKLMVENSTFESMVSQGHAIKSRSKVTIVKNSLLSTGQGKDSRLIDVANGGELHVSNSVLYQNDRTVNRQVIGYGLENYDENNSNNISVLNNLFVMERVRGNEFLALPKSLSTQTIIFVDSNIFVGEFIDSENWQNNNYQFKNRQQAMLMDSELPDVSLLPKLFDFYKQLERN